MSERITIYYKLRDITPLPIRKIYRPVRRYFYNRFKRAQPLLLDWFYQLWPRHKQVFFILSTPRAGTQLMISLLRNHRELSVISGEPLHELRIDRLGLAASPPAEILEYLRNRLNWSWRRRCGGKLMGYQLARLNIRLAQLQAAFPAARYIVLYRQDLLRQFISWETASRTKLWSLSRDAALGTSADQSYPLQINAQALTEYCEAHRSFYTQIAANAEIGARAIWCSYEALAEDPQRVFSTQIFPFLGVPAVAVHSKLRKINHREPADVISNFEQIKPLIEAQLTRCTPEPARRAAFSRVQAGDIS